MGHRQNRWQAFGIIIRSVGSYKEIMSDRFHHRDIEKGSRRERWPVSAERHLLLWTCKAWVHGALGMTHPKEFRKAGPPMPFPQFTLISALVGLGSPRSTKGQRGDYLAYLSILLGFPASRGWESLLWPCFIIARL